MPASPSVRLSTVADSAALGSLLYGPDTHAKVLLLDHKDAVAEMLIAAAQQHEPH